jgi:hypothetical protein
MVGLSAFLAAFTAAYATLNVDPGAAAAFCIIAPFALHHAASARAARRMAEAPPDEATLRARFRRLRLQSYAAAAASVMLAAVFRAVARIAALYG